MKLYLEHRLSTLKILTVISFLLVYGSGDKFGMMMGLMLFIYPLLIMDGAGNIFNLDLQPLGIMFIDTFFIFATYWSLYYLIRSGIKGVDSAVNSNFCILAILILTIGPIKVLVTSSNSIFSLLTVIIFGSLAIATVIISLGKPKSN